MSYRVTIHSSAPIGHHGKAKTVSYETRAGAVAYARTAREKKTPMRYGFTMEVEHADGGWSIVRFTKTSLVS